MTRENSGNLERETKDNLDALYEIPGLFVEGRLNAEAREKYLLFVARIIHDDQWKAVERYNRKKQK